MSFTKGDNVTDNEIGEMDCGCIIFQRTSYMLNETRTLVQYCPKHEAAPAMYEALQLWATHQCGTRGHYCEKCAGAIFKALTKAEEND